MAGKVVDLFMIYQFLKRLATPFDKWDAFKLGIIDADGKVLRKSSTLKTQEEKDSWGYFDRLVANLKKLLGKVPGGKTRIASYAAALLLLKESVNEEDKSEEELLSLLEDEIANVAGAGKIAGMGVGPQGEPPVNNKKPILAKMLKRRKLNAI